MSALTTPRQDGFRMPAEFEPHAATWMLWPERPDVWREGAVPAQKKFAEIAGTIAEFEPVRMGVLPEMVKSARKILPAKVDVVPLPYDDAWARDNGPTFLVNDAGELRGIDWEFNAWGGLYADFAKDRQLARTILAHEKIPCYRSDWVIEGGGLDVDGEGTLLLTEQCVLSDRRNPGRSKAEVEAHLKSFLTVDTVIWLKDGVYLDETSGHIDNLCCFISPGVVALTWTDNQNDPQYMISQDAYRRLSDAVDARGHKLKIIKLHQPDPMYRTEEEIKGLDKIPGSYARDENQFLPASYINYYVFNGGVLVPQFDNPRDAEAMNVLKHLFPDREVIGLHSREVLLGGGNIHCITQQQPEVMTYA